MEVLHMLEADPLSLRELVDHTMHIALHKAHYMGLDAVPLLSSGESQPASASSAGRIPVVGDRVVPLTFQEKDNTEGHATLGTETPAVDASR